MDKRHGVAGELEPFLVETLREECSVANEGEIRRVVLRASGNIDQLTRRAAVCIADPERRAVLVDSVEEETMSGADGLRPADVGALLHGEELARRATAARDGEHAMAGGD